MNSEPTEKDDKELFYSLIRWWEWPIITLFFIIGNAAYLVFELCRLPGRLWRGIK